MTKPIRNTGPCFHLSLPRQRGQRDVLSHTEFINVHILHALSLPGHPLRVTRKPPTADWWVLLLALPEETSITINIVPCVKCAPETATTRSVNTCSVPISQSLNFAFQIDTFPLHATVPMTKAKGAGFLLTKNIDIDDT